MYEFHTKSVASARPTRRTHSAAAGFTAHATADGEPLAAHQAFWFAWSQFHPETDLWTR